MKTIKAKTLMQPVKYSEYWFAYDYNMNLYRGCCHGCIYCDSRSSCYRIENFDEVCVKEELYRLLSRELAYKKKGVIGMGAMGDPYNPFEVKEEATRSALKEIMRNGYGLGLATKSDLIIRDIDLFEEIQKNHNLILKVSITCADDELSKMVEPNVCVSSKRFAAVKELSDRGLFVGVLFTPWLPFITDTEENVKKMVRQTYQSGAKFIFATKGVTLRENQRDYYYDQLDKRFPGLSDKYKQAYRNQYMCETMNKGLFKVFEQECERYGLIYKMKDIIKAYKRPIGYVQESMF